MNLLAETEWKIGDKCYAIFSEDELYYPAIITKVKFRNNPQEQCFDY